jgi:DNA-binding GntR family transcriptional regulator
MQGSPLELDASDGSGLSRPAGFSLEQGTQSTLSRPILKDAIAEIIREDIFSGRLRPGERVNQDEFAERLGVSRLPVREALILLKSEGLVDSIPHRGTFVHAITPDDIRDHYTVFGLVAGVAVERAASRLSEEDLAAIRQAYDHTREQHSTAKSLQQANFEFHRLINLAGASQRLRFHLLLLTKTIPWEFFAARFEWQTRAQDDHRNLVAALEQRDGSLAAEVMRSHLRRSGDFAVRVLEEVGFWDGADTQSATSDNLDAPAAG